jgi:protein involved in polysaccharide export with SLBB domain
MISMPLLGDVQAAGKTTLQLSDEITVKLKKYIQDPNVTVVLGQVNSKIVYLLGEVAKPGPIGMTPGMTFLQAIATAGGLTQFAIQTRIEGRQLTQSRSESRRYDCRTIEAPNESKQHTPGSFPGGERCGKSAGCSLCGRPLRAADQRYPSL